MNIEVIRYRLPVYWACALINGDYTDLSDEEEREINNFLEQAEGYPVDVDLETEGFYRCNDANDIAGSCADFIFHKCNNSLIGAVLQKELGSVLGENVNKSISRNMKIKATKYRSDYRVWLDYAGDYRNENIE